MKSTLRSQCLLACFSILGLAMPVRACQVTCVEYELTSGECLLKDYEGHPLANAKLLIRDASSFAKGPEVMCGRKGPVLKKIHSDKEGRFKLKRLLPGKYWITYLDKKQGQSFLIVVEEGHGPSSEPLELTVGRFDGNQCYLIDIERNATISPNWPVPLKK